METYMLCSLVLYQKGYILKLLPLCYTTSVRIKPMKQLKDYHHYKGNYLTPSEKVEREIIQLLIDSPLPNSQRVSSQVFEIKHASDCAVLGRILAQKRGLDMDIAEVACALHDVYVALEGKNENHAKMGAHLAEEILRKIGGFSDQQIKTIVEAVAHHSEKDIHSDNPYIELVKDVDVFDCSLYKGSEDYYRLHKPQPVFKEYVKRIKNVRKELGLPEEPVFRT